MHSISSEKLTAALSLSRQPVGVRFLTSKESYLSATSKELTHKMPYCVMVKVAMAGVSIKASLENMSCRGARNVLGLTEPLDSFLSGESGKNLGLYCDQEVACEAASKLTRIQTRSYGIEIRPLADFEQEPDIVIVVTTPYNVMRLLQGYGFENGVLKNCSISGNQAFCSELTAEPFVNGSLNVSLLCSGTRFWCGWKKEEMGIGMPYGIFEDVVNGVCSTLNATEPLIDKMRIQEDPKAQAYLPEIDLSRSYYFTYNEAHRKLAKEQLHGK